MHDQGNAFCCNSNFIWKYVLYVQVSFNTKEIIILTYFRNFEEKEDRNNTHRQRTYTHVQLRKHTYTHTQLRTNTWTLTWTARLQDIYTTTKITVCLCVGNRSYFY